MNYRIDAPGRSWLLKKCRLRDKCKLVYAKLCWVRREFVAQTTTFVANARIAQKPLLKSKELGAL
jgi:hypothetical protein